MKVRLQKFAAAVLFMSIGITVSSCTFKSLYGQLDYIIPSYVEGMVTLDNILESKLEEHTQQFLTWHRKTQLQQYAEWFKELQKDINQQLTENKLQQHVTKLNDFFRSAESKLNDEMAAFLPLLNEAQQKELFVNIEKNNKEYREDYIDISDEARIQKYEDSIKDNYETWLGDITESQLQAIKQAASSIVSTAKLRLERRLYWQQSIKQLLASDASNAVKTKNLRAFFKEYIQNKNDKMKALEEANTAVFTRLTVQLVHSMSNEQRSYFINKTHDYIRMFNELSNELAPYNNTNT